MPYQITQIGRARGFTIVELLIVIVVIAILAAITIIAFNGISNRSKTSSAASAATNAIKKAEAYAIETGAYPSQPSVLTGAAATTSYQLTGVNPTTATLSSSTNPNDLNFYRCGTAAAGTAGSLAAVTVITGIQFRYWDYGGSLITKSAGQTSGTSPGGYAINCYITAA